MQNQRSEYFDNAKGVAILFVVLGHILYIFIKEEFSLFIGFSLIYFWHMPLFVLLAGYFSSTKFQPLKIISLFLIPYVAMEIFYGYTDFLLYKKDFAITLNHPNWGMWFLLSFACWRLAWPFLYKIPFIFLISLFLAIIVGYIDVIGKEYSFSRTITFFPFFIAGFTLKQKYTKQAAINIARKWALPAIVVSVAAVFIYFSLDYDFRNYRWLLYSWSYEGMNNNEIWAGILRAIFIAGSVGWIISIMYFVPKNLSYLSVIGRNSLNIYLLHIFFLDILRANKVPEILALPIENNLIIAWAIIIVVALLLTAFLASKPAVIIGEFIYRPNIWIAKLFKLIFTNSDINKGNQ